MAYSPLLLVRAFDPRSRLGLSVSPPFGFRSASLASPTTGSNMPHADFCSAVRSPYDHLSRPSDTGQISWGKLSHFPCTIAESTFRTLMDYGLRGNVALLSGAGAFYSVFVHRLARLFNASFRPRLAAVALASSLGLHLHQVGQKTFTSKLLSMPSTQRNRSRGRALRLAASTWRDTR